MYYIFQNLNKKINLNEISFTFLDFIQFLDRKIINKLWVYRTYLR